MRLRSLLFAGVAALGLAGCSGPRAPLNPPQLVTDAETDMSLQLFMQATILLSKYYGYQTVKYEAISERSANAGFRSIPFMPPVTVRATPALMSFADNDQLNTLAFRTSVEQTIGYKGLVAYYIKIGLRASQVVCRNYLLGLDEKNQYLNFIKKEFGVVGSLADGILLAVSANGSLLHAFALGRDAANNGINAYEDYRFLSIDREAARGLVETAQSKYAAYFLDQLNKSGSLQTRAATGDLPEFFTFSDALNAVSTIEYQCTRSGIQSLLTRAVNNTPTNLDVDRKTGTIMFKSSSDVVGTADTIKKVPSPEQPSASGANAPTNATVKPPAGETTPAPSGQTQ